MTASPLGGLAAFTEFMNLKSILTLLDLSTLPEFAAYGLTLIGGLGAGALQIFLAMLLADFLGAVFHWWQDTYADPKWPIIGRVLADPNIEHHHRPRAVTKAAFWERNRVILPAMAVTACLVFPLFGLNIFTLALLVTAAMASEIHVWAHRTPKENGPIIDFLQKTRVIQGFRHHLNHHSGEKESHFAVVTPWVNPVLERLNFWEGLTFGVERLFGVKPRDESISDIHAR